MVRTPSLGFYLHPFDTQTTNQSEHKIQSGKGSLILEMDQVPKILKPMVDEWTPEGFVVSFKVSSILKGTTAYTHTFRPTARNRPSTPHS